MSTESCNIFKLGICDFKLNQSEIVPKWNFGKPLFKTKNEWKIYNGFAKTEFHKNRLKQWNDEKKPMRYYHQIARIPAIW